ncbi:MAG: hypothetical protein AB8F95_07280 [Bacteroidia bacterium]
MKISTKTRLFNLVLCFAFASSLVLSSCEAEIIAFCEWQVEFTGGEVTFDECSASFDNEFAYFGGFDSNSDAVMNIFDYTLEEGTQEIDTNSVDGLNANFFMGGERYDAVSGSFEFTEVIIDADTNVSAKMDFVLMGPNGQETFVATAENVLLNK